MASQRPPSAVWLYRKPVGATSSSVVDAHRNAHRGPWTLKVSHGGVLDPFASGLVVVLVGAANRLFELLHDAPKRYVATVEWGAETDTGDAGGVRGGTSQSAEELTVARLDTALTPFRGWTAQVPPNTSNKRVNGERAWAKAHRGEAFELPPQQVYAHELKWRSHELPARSVLELTVRGGFYVRSLARDLGRALGVGAHLSALERTHLGSWTHAEAPRQLIGHEVLPWLPSAELTDAQWGVLRATESGASVDPSPRAGDVELPSGFPTPRGVRCFHLGRLVAVTQASSGKALLLPGGV